MVILLSEIVYRLSGGASNSDPNASLAGVKSSVALVDNNNDNLFADSLGPESASGSTKYRCIYVHNANGSSLTMFNSKFYITSVTSSTDTDITIGVGAAAINATETAIANETTAPASVSFSSTAVSYATGLALGDIPAGQHKAIWFKRIVNAGAAAANDAFSFEVGCDSNP